MYNTSAYAPPAQPEPTPILSGAPETIGGATFTYPLQGPGRQVESMTVVRNFFREGPLVQQDLHIDYKP